MSLLRPIALALLTLAACVPSDPGTSQEPSPPDAAEDIAPDLPVDTRTCIPPSGLGGSPNTIEEAVALINALPRPVTLSCFLESLDRPLRMNATFGTISAQPAVGRRSPRIFLFSNEDLIMSVALDGVGQHLLEFGQLVAPGTSRKGELEFPVTERVMPSDPYTKIMFREDLTTCAFCHASERLVPDVTFADIYESRALRPVEREQLSIPEVREQYLVCEREEEENERCDMLRALFSHGYVGWQAFPEDMVTIFD